MSSELFRTLLSTPFGPMQIAVDTRGVLIELLLPSKTPATGSQTVFPSGAAAAVRIVERQLDDYFAGRRRDFDLPFAPRGTDFERRVWRRLCAIPYGQTTSYGAIASEFGLANGARAVGGANGANPIAIVIPCHRVIGMDGRLTGYGGGLPLKKALLELEGAIAPADPALF